MRGTLRANSCTKRKCIYMSFNDAWLRCSISGRWNERSKQFNIHSQQTVGLSNIYAMIWQPNKTATFKYPAHSTFYYPELRHVKKEKLTIKYWRENSIYSGRRISTQEVSNLPHVLVVLFSSVRMGRHKFRGE